MTFALVLGSAACLWADLEAANRLVPAPLIVACNDAGWQYPGHLDHWGSFHAHQFAKWKPMRTALGGNTDFITWSNEPKAKYVDRVYPTPAQGSSGWLVMMIGLDQADLAILCGLPLDPKQKHIDGNIAHKPGEPWTPARNYQPQWEKWKKKNPALAARVRSMSGWTRTLLGGPDEAWLTTLEQAP